MAVLKNLTKNQILAPQLDVAENFMQRLAGLIPKKEITSGEGLWIKKCQSIHTLFMSFAIDCIFVDRDLQVKGLVKDIQPWRMTKFYFSADSVFELAAGSIEKFRVEMGDQLHVGA